MSSVAGLSWAALDGMQEADQSFLDAFHRGDPVALDACYRKHLPAVLASVGLASRADRETVAHELFCRLIGNEEFRRGFRGGSLGAWLRTAARHAAVDYARKHRREILTDEPVETGTHTHHVDPSERRDAERIVARFVAEKLPPEWRSVFDTRFVRALGQHETARALGMSRTTVMYQEHRIRALLRTFLLKEYAR